MEDSDLLKEFSHANAMDCRDLRRHRDRFNSLGKALSGVHERVPYNVAYLNPADMAATWADISKAKKHLEWKPQTHLREGLGKLDAMGKAAFKQALDDIRELSELAAKSQADAFTVVRNRIRDNVDEVSKLLQPRK